jgi:hypothetical protein
MFSKEIFGGIVVIYSKVKSFKTRNKSTKRTTITLPHIVVLTILLMNSIVMYIGDTQFYIPLLRGGGLNSPSEIYVWLVKRNKNAY